MNALKTPLYRFLLCLLGTFIIADTLPHPSLNVGLISSSLSYIKGQAVAFSNNK
jgi:hypothetical protein